MRNELFAVLSQVTTDVDAILQSLDNIACNYEISDREVDNLTELDILNNYINSCKYEKMSVGTIENYQLVLGHMLRKLQLPIDSISTNDLRNYLRTYQAERGISDTTLNKYREYIRSFFGWCCNEGYIAKNPAANIRPIRSERKQKAFLTQTEL
jgi:site-specific recombinase XerD